MISVLLVDDEPQLLELTKLFLEKTGDISVDPTQSADDASRKMNQRVYDAVVCDYQMPSMDGLEFLKALRNQKNDIPFVLFTGKGREDVAIEALNSGADFYLQKGGEPNAQFAELANMLRSAVSSRRAERDLARKEELFRLLAENSRDLVYRYELIPERRFEYVSPSATRIVGYTPEEHYANPELGIELVLPEDRHILMAMMRNDSDFSRPAIVRWRTKDGRIIWTEQRIVPIRDKVGRVVAIEGTAIDITKRVEAEEELRRSEAEYRMLVMTTPCLICTINPDGSIAFVNDYVHEIAGYNQRELIGRNWWEVFYPGHLRAQVDALTKEFAKGDVSGYEMTMMDKDGALKILLWNSFNSWAEDGETIALINFAGVDVTARKAAENALRESGAFNRAVLDSLDANIAVLDGSGKIIAVNKSWLVFAGQNDADLSRIGVGADYLAVCDSAAARGDAVSTQVADAIRSVMKGASSSFSLEYPCDSPDEKRWFILQVSPLPKRRGSAVVSHIDITVRKLMEEALRASEAHYRSIFETTGSAMVIIDGQSTIALINSEFERLSGYSKAEIQGKMKWTSFVEKADLKRLEEYHAARLKDPETAPRTYQFRAMDRFGSEKSLLANAAVVPGTTRTIVSLVDETERRYYEDAMQQVSKKMDLLARITRHDILNQLAVLYGYLELAEERVADKNISPLLAKARMASESIKRHLEFARDYQNMGTKRPQWVDIQAACRRAATNMELKDVKIIAEMGGVEVFSDPMLEKVFYNLIDNSIKHGEKASRLSFGFSVGSGGMRLIYEDDGVGIPEEDKEAIFDRSAGDREGRRGYGLYLAREILGITGITLTETGKHGDGARFEMLVPRGKYRTKEDLGHKMRGKKTRRR